MVTPFDPSNPSEVALAAALYVGAAGDARDVLDWLIDHPDERIEGWDLAERLGFEEHKRVGLAMSALGEAAAAQERARPWGEGQLGYLMPIDQAALFRAAREQVWRESDNR